MFQNDKGQILNKFIKQNSNRNTNIVNLFYHVSLKEVILTLNALEITIVINILIVKENHEKFYF